MRLVLLALLVVAAAGLRPKRTLGVIFRGLVDATAKQTQQKAGKVEKLKSPPPPAKIYIIPVPERDKNSQVQLFNTQAPFTYKNTTRQLYTRAPSTENFVTLSSTVAPKKNNTAQEAKQYLIRILNEEGKSFMVRITGDDVQVKKKGNGYMIGVSHNEAKANINIELPEKTTTSKSELFQTTANYLNKTPPPLYTGFPSTPEKYQLLNKGVTTPEKLLKPSPSIIHPFPAYPYPIFIAPHFFQPQAYPYENRFHTHPVTPFPTTIEKPHDTQYFTPTNKPDTEDITTKTTKEVTKPTGFQVTVRLKGEPEIKETIAEMRKTTTTEKPTTQSAGYHYPGFDHNYQYPPLEPRYQYPPAYQEANPPRYQQSYPEAHPPSYQQPYPDSNPPRYQQAYPEEEPSRYHWYLQPPAPPQQQADQQADQPRDYQQNNWNLAQFTPYPSYLQDTLSPPYLSSGYGRAAGQKK